LADSHIEMFRLEFTNGKAGRVKVVGQFLCQSLVISCRFHIDHYTGDVLALMLVYMVMAAQFKSLIDPFIIMFAVPMGFPGVILILFLTDTTLSTTSMMGIIMMFGIVVSNGVLLVDYTNVLRRKGRPLLDAVVAASRTRLRPILMTSLATVFGLLPMAIGLGTGGETNAPLARAVVGGLSVSTLLTLFLIPTVYVMLEDRIPRKLEGERQAPLP